MGLASFLASIALDALAFIALAGIIYLGLKAYDWMKR